MAKNDTILRGVNLGGWLILEKWMTPSLFKGTGAIDEYTFMQTPSAIKKIQKHRKSFITEDDFKWLADKGVNAIRLPVGYWVLEGDGPYVAAIEHVDFAVDMCEKYNLHLLIDLHGAPGSQNGNDHSGRVGDSNWYGSKTNQARSIDVLKRLAKRYYDRKCVWGYQLLNEPKPGVFQFELRRYYKEAYRQMVSVCRPGIKIVFHDAFTTLLMSGVIRSVSGYQAVIDRHWYHFFQWFKDRLPLGVYFKKIRYTKYYFRVIRCTQPLIVGEWSGVLSGRRVSGMTTDEKRLMQARHIGEQLRLYEAETDGWFYWSYKTESPGVWSFKTVVDRGLVKLS